MAHSLSEDERTVRALVADHNLSGIVMASDDRLDALMRSGRVRRR